MSEIIPVLVSVIIGFILGTGYSEFKSWLSRKRLKKQLKEELKANLYSILQKKSTTKTIIIELGRKKVLPGNSVMFCDTIYKNHYPYISPHWT